MANVATSKTKTLVLNTLGGLAILFLILVVLGIYGGPKFRPIVKFLGLTVITDAGIFTNCSNPANKYNEFCMKAAQRNKAPGDFRDIDHNANAFSLSGK